MSRRVWSVEAARPEDTEAVLRVQQRAFAANQRRHRAVLPQLREGRAEVAAAIAVGLVLVARQGDEVVGSVRVRTQAGRAETSHLAVLPAYARLAVGRSLMAAAEAAARARGGAEMVVFTGLRDAAAISFYLRLGYRPDALLPDPREEIDLVRFRRDL